MDQARIPLLLLSFLGALGCEHGGYDHSGSYTSDARTEITTSYAGVSSVRETVGQARLRVRRGDREEPTMHVVYRGLTTVDGERFSLDCTGLGSRSPHGASHEYLTILTPRCRQVGTSCAMVPMAPFLLRPARHGGWDLDPIEIAAPEPRVDACDSLPERVRIELVPALRRT